MVIKFEWWYPEELKCWVWVTLALVMTNFVLAATMQLLFWWCSFCFSFRPRVCWQTLTLSEIESEGKAVIQFSCPSVCTSLPFTPWGDRAQLGGCVSFHAAFVFIKHQTLPVKMVFCPPPPSLYLLYLMLNYRAKPATTTASSGHGVQRAAGPSCFVDQRHLPF